MRRWIAVAFACGLINVASAEVISAGPGGFEVQHEVVVNVERSLAWKVAIDGIGQWWHDDHTIAGDSSRMSIDARPQGCFCETLLGDDGVVHLVVTTVSSNVMLRMTGGLGPLGLMGVNGNMTWEFFDDEGGTRVRFSYAVGGYRSGGLDAVAAPVDYVIGDALQRLKSFAEGRNPDDVDGD